MTLRVYVMVLVITDVWAFFFKLQASMCMCALYCESDNPEIHWILKFPPYALGSYNFIPLPCREDIYSAL